MSVLPRILLTLLLAVAAALPAAAQEKPFVNAGVAKDAERYETFIGATYKPQKGGQDFKAQGLQALSRANDPRAASRAYAQAAAADPKDATAWLGLARALLAITPDANRSSERYDLPVNASGAAWLAYQRAQGKPLKAQALVVLSDALKRRSYWRPAIDALSASLTLVDQPETRQAYDLLRAEHGFRILEYKVDADAAQPRLCIQFSERLATGQTDWAKFFTVDGKDPVGVSAETQQICLDGFAHGKRYEVQVRAGLPSAIASESLSKTADLAVYVRDRTPSVRATGRNYVLPNKGQQGIPLVTVNTERVGVEVYRIGDRGLAQVLQSGDFQKAISSYETEAIKERTGARVYSGELATQVRLNEDVTTAFPVSEAIPTLQPGVYVLSAYALPKKDNGGQAATQWFIVSDLGLTAFSAADGVHAFVRSLATAQPVARASVRLVAKNNEVLGTATTDERGYARFDAALKRGEGGQAPAILVAETGQTTGQPDYAFLDLSAAAFDLTDRGVKGREAPGPIDAYAYTDRGVYRPGEPVHLTTLLRQRDGLPATLPATVIFVRPDGVEHSRVALTDQAQGGRTTTLALNGGAMTGTWHVRVHTDPKSEALADVAFLVEDFVPERLELKLEPASAAVSPGDPAKVKVAGRYLYGPPAAGLSIEGETVVRLSSKDVPGFAGYRFGLADDQVSPVRKTLEGLPQTGDDGRADVPVDLPALVKTSRPLEAEVIVRLRESGGRTIERSIVIPVDLRQPRIGIKPLFTSMQIGDGDTAAFNAVLLDASGKAVAAKDLKWELLRLDRRWQWYNRDGSWAYETTTHTRRIASGSADATADKPAEIAAKVGWGRYRLEVSSPDGAAVSSIEFNAGYWAEEAAESPEILDVALDKTAYRVGDTARIKITSRVAGKALVAVLGSGLLATKEVDLPAGGGEVTMKVEKDWAPGAYATVLHYRAMDEKAKRMPNRAIGLRWVAVDQSDNTLKVAMDVPEKIKSGSQLVVPVKLGGLKTGEEAHVTIAAVDVGILNLTRFEAPKPEAWFFGQRRLSAEIRDFYGRLIDGMRAERGALRSGGDGTAGMTMHGSPPVEKTVALFSGIVRVGDDGVARATFDMPDFNGTVRLSAVAWSGTKLGSASRDVIVRDAVALVASGPRFLTLGDEARLEISVHNVEGPAADYAISADYSGGMTGQAFARSVALKAGERKREAFTLKPTDVGQMSLVVRVAGPGGIDVHRTLTFDVKPPASDIKRLTVSELAANGGRITVSSDLLADMIPSRSKVILNVGPMAAMDPAGLLASLDRYPYGCAEQTVSRALPLLYANDVARQIGVADDAKARERVQKAIARVFEMQDASGAFGIWGPSDGDMWLTSYVTDFLSRAKEAGYSVPQRQLGLALDRLQNFISYAQDFEKGGEDRAYALYVLARNGRAPVGELRYYVDTRLDRFATPLSQAQLGAALAMLGDMPRAERAFHAALQTVSSPDDGLSRRDYGTSLRDGAALVTLAAETRVARNDVPRLVNVIAKAYASKTYTSTQEQAWMLLAVRALADQAKDTRLTVGDAPQTGPLLKTLTAAQLKSGAVVVTNRGDAAVDATVSVIGSALTPEPAIVHGFKIERSYYTLDGRKVELESANGGESKVAQNDRLVVVLKVDAPEAGGRILLVDRLPAGLEIENPRLVDSGDIKSLSWLKTTVEPGHTEFRDDRFVAAFDFFGSERRQRNDNLSGATVAYVVRAVTPGRYVHPAATVEDMYRPDRFARTGAGHLEVTARN
ncbi:MAG: alpha-2-macroglobulin [Hyphomicrobiaceae bacterium]